MHAGRVHGTNSLTNLTNVRVSRCHSANSAIPPSPDYAKEGRQVACKPDFHFLTSSLPRAVSLLPSSRPSHSYYFPINFLSGSGTVPFSLPREALHLLLSICATSSSPTSRCSSWKPQVVFTGCATPPPPPPPRKPQALRTTISN